LKDNKLKLTHNFILPIPSPLLLFSFILDVVKKKTKTNSHFNKVIELLLDFISQLFWYGYDCGSGIAKVCVV